LLFYNKFIFFSVLAVFFVSVSSPAYALTDDFIFKFGSTGTANGEFGSPADAAVDSNGRIIVVDEANHNFQIFDSRGNFVSKIGTQGSGEGQFSFPNSVAVDSNDRIIVADGGNDRIQIFDSNGNFVTMFGFGVDDGSNAFQTCISSCQAGTNGSGDGQFRLIREMTVDSNDRIIVADEDTARIQIFSSTPAFVLKFGSLGSAEGQFSSPQGVATDSNNRIIVSDFIHNRVSIFSSTGTFVTMFGFGVDDGSNAFQTCTSSCQAGIIGSADGQFTSPQGVAVGSADRILVVDASARIQVFDSTGAFESKFGSSGTGDGQFTSPSDVATAPDDKIIVADLNNDRIQVFGISYAALTEFGSNGSGDLQFISPEAVTVDSNDRIIVGDGDNFRVSIFESDGSFVLTFGFGVQDGSNAFQICTSGCQAGTSGTGDGQFDVVISVATDSNNRIIVGDDNNRVQIFDSAGNFVKVLGTFGTSEGQFSFPNSVAVDSNDRIIVGDGSIARVQVFDSNDDFEFMFGFGVDDGSAVFQTCTSGCQAGSTGSGDGQFSALTSGVVTDLNNRIIVQDQSNQRVSIFDSTGTFELMFGWGVDDGSAVLQTCTSGCQAGIGGGGIGQFQNMRGGITVDSANQIIVSSNGNKRVHVYDSTGNLLARFGTGGTNLGEFGSNESLYVDSNDRIIVADTTNDRIQIFDTNVLAIDTGTSGTTLQPNLSTAVIDLSIVLETMTVPSDVTSPKIQYAGSAFDSPTDTATTHGEDLTISSSNTATPVTTLIQHNTIITGTGWDGELNLPTASTVSISGISNSFVMQFGDPDRTLTFSNSVSLTITGQAGLRAFITESTSSEITVTFLRIYNGNGLLSCKVPIPLYFYK